MKLFGPAKDIVHRVCRAPTSCQCLITHELHNILSYYSYFQKKLLKRHIHKCQMDQFNFKQT